MGELECLSRAEPRFRGGASPSNARLLLVEFDPAPVSQPSSGEITTQEGIDGPGRLSQGAQRWGCFCGRMKESPAWEKPSSAPGKLRVYPKKTTWKSKHKRVL
jgi:hypothetical protein